MSPDPHLHGRTQEQSIKARKHQLFEDDEVVQSAPSVPFAELLRTTPPDPLSPAIKALLWGVGVLVGLLLAAALLTSGGGRKPKPKVGHAHAPMMKLVRAGQPAFDGVGRPSVG